LELDRGRIRINALNRKRARFLTTASLILLSGPTHPYTEVTYTDDWYLDKKEYQELATGKRYFKLYVGDQDRTRKTELEAATAIRVANTQYKFVAKDSFITSLDLYEFKVQPTGERN
jgi:hypothetical protein